MASRVRNKTRQMTASELVSRFQEAYYLAPEHFRSNLICILCCAQLKSEYGSPISSNHTLKPAEALMILSVHWWTGLLIFWRCLRPVEMLISAIVTMNARQALRSRCKGHSLFSQRKTLESPQYKSSVCLFLIHPVNFGSCLWEQFGPSSAGRVWSLQLQERNHSPHAQLLSLHPQ